VPGGDHDAYAALVERHRDVAFGRPAITIRRRMLDTTRGVIRPIARGPVSPAAVPLSSDRGE
jgi:hypothetical protein